MSIMTIGDLNKKTWYRLIKVLYITVFVVLFLISLYLLVDYSLFKYSPYNTISGGYLEYMYILFYGSDWFAMSNLPRYSEEFFLAIGPIGLPVIFGLIAGAFHYIIAGKFLIPVPKWKFVGNLFKSVQKTQNELSGEGIKQKKSSKNIWTIALLGISIILIIFADKIDADLLVRGYTIGYLAVGVLAKVVVWSVIFLVIAYVIWRLLAKRQPLLLVFAVLFFIASIFELGGSMYVMYATAQLNEIINSLDLIN